jgi:hypothetical protein
VSDTAIEPSGSETSLQAPVAAPIYDDGLGDFDSSDMVMPRIGIEHSEGVYVDNLTGEKHETIEVVMLGLVKQRIMWHPDMDDKSEGPLCKSVDGKFGNARGGFVWADSGFEKTDDPLSCGDCKFAKWGNDTPPPCSEQYTIPLMMPGAEGEFDAPAIITFQKSGIKAVKKFLTAFKRSNKPLFTARTKLTLDVRKRGSVTYSVPSLARVGDTEPEDHSMFAENYRTIREYLHSAEDTPAEDAEKPVGTSDVDNSHNDDDDVPF